MDFHVSKRYLNRWRSVGAMQFGGRYRPNIALTNLIMALAVGIFYSSADASYGENNNILGFSEKYQAKLIPGLLFHLIVMPAIIFVLPWLYGRSISYYAWQKSSRAVSLEMFRRVSIDFWGLRGGMRPWKQRDLSEIELTEDEELISQVRWRYWIFRVGSFNLGLLCGMAVLFYVF